MQPASFDADRAALNTFYTWAARYGVINPVPTVSGSSRRLRFQGEGLFARSGPRDPLRPAGAARRQVKWILRPTLAAAVGAPAAQSASGRVRSLFMGGHLATQIADTHLVLERTDGRILLLVRANTGYMDGRAGLPAGHVEPGEPADAAMIREAKEELGIIIDPADLAFVHVMHRRTAGEDTPRVSFFFTASLWTGEVINAEPHVCAGLLWSDPASLPDHTIGYIADALEAVRAGRGFTAHGW